MDEETEVGTASIVFYRGGHRLIVNNSAQLYSKYMTDTGLKSRSFDGKPCALNWKATYSVQLDSFQQGWGEVN